MVRRRFDVEETIYVRGNPDRHLYFVAEGVVKLYKGYGGHKEAIVRCWRRAASSVSPYRGLEDVHSDSAEVAPACLIEPRGKGRIVLLDKLRLEEIARNQVV